MTLHRVNQVGRRFKEFLGQPTVWPSERWRSDRLRAQACLVIEPDAMGGCLETPTMPLVSTNSATVQEAKHPRDVG